MSLLRRLFTTLLPIALATFSPWQSNGQTAVGVQKFGAYDGSPDVIDMRTLGLHLELPLYRKIGRGRSTGIDITFSNYANWPQSWVVGPGGQAYYFYGPSISFGVTGAGSLSNLSSTSQCRTMVGSGTFTDYVYTYTDARGNSHLFPGTVRTVLDNNNTCSGAGITAHGLTAQASDGSGFLLQAGPTSGNVTDPSGSSFGLQVPTGTSLSGSIGDSNGNYISAFWNGSSGTLTYQLTDTLGSSLNISGGEYNSDFTNRNPLVVTYLDDTGTQQTISLTYTMTQLPGGGSQSLVDSIVFPDGSAYHFTYTSLFSKATISSITLPSGGVISYSYQTATTPCGIGSIGYTQSLTRTTTDGTTTYIQTPTSVSTTPFCAITSSWTQATKANGDKTNFYFVVPQHQASYMSNNGKVLTGWLFDSTKTIETKRVEYDHSNLTTPVRTTTRCYNGATGDCTTTSFNEPITQLAATTTLDNGLTSKIVTQYNALSLPIEVDEYDFGASAPSRKTVTTYNTSLTNNIADRPSSVIVYDAAGNTASKTTYSYDETTPPPLTLPGHTTVSGSRGNVTSAYRWILSSNQSLRTQSSYDDAGQLLTTTDALGNVTSYAYDSATDAFRTTTTRPATNSVAHVSTASYGSGCGQVTSSHDENNQLTSYTYDSMCRLSAVTSPDGGQVTYSYTATSTVTTRLATSGISIGNTTLKDGYGRVIQAQLTTDPDGATFIDTTYDAMGRVKTVSNPHRATTLATDGTTTSYYDALGRICLVVPPDGTVPSGNGCPTSPPNNTIFTTYSGNTTTVFDQAGKARKSVTDGLGRLTQVFEDPAGLNYETDYSYDVLGNLLTVNQKGGSTNSANWRTRTFAYDSLSRLLTAANPESGTISYAYDANGNLSTKTSPKPNQTGAATVVATYTYDALNRLTQKSFNDGPPATPTVKYGYDGTALTGCTFAPPSLTITNPIGRRTAMCDGAGSEAWAYDSMGRVLFEQRKTNNITKQFAYTYNLDGSLATQTYPSTNPADVWPTHTMPLTNTQGGAGRSLSLYNGTIGIAYNVKYTPGGAVCFMNSGWGNSFTERYTFNNRLQPVAMQVYGTGYGTSPAPPPCAASTDTAGTQLNLAYNFVDASGHNNGNVVSITNNVYTPRSQSFTYDSLNRLKTAQTTSTYATNAANCWAETYSYDPWGNLTKLGADTTNQSAYIGCTQESGFDFSAPGLIGTNNRIATTGYVYDAAGNLITSPGAGTVTFDAENHMVSAGGQSYAYDGDGNRIWKAPTASPNSPTLIYWYGGSGNLLQESDGAGNGQYSHIYFNGRRIKRIEWLHGGWFDHYAYDHLGNARWVYGYNGAWDLSEYYPFGGERAISSGEGNKFKFTGKERDSESGLDNFGARFGSSVLGRFMSPDEPSMSMDKADPRSLNLYSYVRNNPLNSVDPDGHDCVYLNNAGNGVESIDHNSNQGECDAHGGRWANGTVENESWVKTYEDSDTVKIFSHYKDIVGTTYAGPGWSHGDKYAADWIPYAQAHDQYLLDNQLFQWSAWNMFFHNGNGIAGAWGEPEDETPASAPVGRRGSNMYVGPGEEGGPPTNRPAVIGGRLYRGHALDRLQGRGLTPTVVEEIIANGERSPGSRPGTTEHSAQGITIVTNQAGDVVTVMYSRK